MSRKTVVASLRLGAILWAIVAVSPDASATKPAYLAQWPEVARVLSDQRGADEQDSWARQMAALNQLDRAIEDMADERRWNQLTADELALRGHYRRAAEEIRQQAHGALSNDLGPGFHWPWEEAPLQAWNSLQWRYESDPAFRHATLARYLSPEVLGELDARKTASDERAHAVGRQMMEELGYRESTWSSIGATGQDAVALIGALLVLVLLPMLWREMRRFGLDPRDPKLLRAGFARYPLGFITGIVDDYKSNSGGYHEGFDLWDGFGWYKVGISGAYIAIPENHLTTAVTANRRKGREIGYVLFLDHDAKSIQPVETVLNRLLAPSAWLPLLVALFAALIGAVSDPVPKAPPLVGALIFAVVAWVITARLARWSGRRRVRHFVDRDAPRVAEAAGKEASRPVPPPARDANGKVTKRSTDDRAAATQLQMDTAAKLVSATLLPAVPAIGSDGKPLRPHVWTEPYFIGFMNVYAVGALRAVAGARAFTKDAIRDVAVLAAVSMASARGVADLAAASRPRNDESEAAKQRRSGAYAAEIVLACFAGNAEALAQPMIQNLKSSGSRAEGVASEPAATDLHPDGPHAATARRALSLMFSEQLAALSAKTA